MELFSFLCFVTLAQRSKFYEAAEALHLSQSSFSKHIQALERSLGAKLFIRLPHGSELTSAGAALLPYAESIIREYSKAEHLIDVYKKNHDKQLVIYTHSFLTHYRLSEMLFRFQSMYPDTQLEIHELESLLASKKIQTIPSIVSILFSEADTKYDNIDQYTLLYDKLILVVGHQHAFADRDRIHISDLRNERFQILRKQTPFLYDFTLKQCRKAGFTPKASPYELWFSTIPEALIRENSISILPWKIAASINSSDIKFLEIDGVEPFTVQVMKNKNNTSEIACSFFEFAKRYVFSATTDNTDLSNHL